MEKLGVESVCADTSTVDANIRLYVGTQLSKDWTLSRLDQYTSRKMEEAISTRSDGMYVSQTWRFSLTLLTCMQVSMGVLPTAKAEEAQQPSQNTFSALQSCSPRRWTRHTRECCARSTNGVV